MFYPIFTFIFVYKSIEGYVLILHKKFLDAHILKLEELIFGINPALALQKIVNKPLTEFLKFSYFSYYFYVPIPALILFYQKRYKELERFVFTITLTFYACYIGFIIYPVQGPWFELKDSFYIKDLEGWFFTELQDFIMKRGAVRGACMPSSHLAVAWVSLFFIKKYFGKKIFYSILPLTLSMTFSIVYNRYHYFTDAVMGLIFAFIFYQICKRLKFGAA
jgi:membrane-associated phospholipid phosphatase